MIDIQNNIEYNYAYFPIFFKKGRRIRDRLYRMLKRKNINCRKYWYPLITDHSIYKEGVDEIFYNAKNLSEAILSLPIYPDLEREYINLIILKI